MTGQLTSQLNQCILQVTRGLNIFEVYLQHAIVTIFHCTVASYWPANEYCDISIIILQYSSIPTAQQHEQLQKILQVFSVSFTNHKIVPSQIFMVATQLASQLYCTYCTYLAILYCIVTVDQTPPCKCDTVIVYS